MVGYSRLVGLDEEGTIARYRQHRLDVFNPLIEQYAGRLVKLVGDGMLVEFASAVNAVQCAIDLQSAMAAAEDDGDDGLRVAYRIGINLGDILIDGDDILGDGVNIAARLEGLAAPGGFCVSAKVFDEVQGKLNIELTDLGERQVKNIAQPIRVYGIGSASSASAESRQSATREKPAVAVLPFDNLSGDPEQQYFSDGLSEDIITLLSAWRSFPVVSRNSSFAFKGTSKDIRQIAKELSARYVIEGSVRKGGNRVRVSAQLIDAATGHHLWADKFDGSLDDIFEIQDQITSQIVAMVEPQMERAERNRTEASRSASLSAWDHYLQGRDFAHHLNPAHNVSAREMFTKALELDPYYSDAYAGLSTTYQRDILFQVDQDRKELEKQALAAAQKAVDLDNNSSLAHLALGGAYMWMNMHDLAVAETRTAVELNPSNVQACLALGNRLDITGQGDQGIPLLEKSLGLHPRDPHSHIYFVQLGRAYINARDYDKALKCLNEAMRRKPDHPHTYHVMAICLGHMGKINEASKAAERCEELHPGFLARRKYWNIYVDQQANDHLTDGLRKAGLVD